METYVSALLREAEIRIGEITEPLDTVYFGGGTPSLLPPALLTRLAEGLKARLPVHPDAEWTTEANPGTLTPDWLEAAMDSGINRISLGMQAAQNRLLKAMGRIHNAGQVEESVKLCRAAGLHNLNLDLMFGLPGQSPEDWSETLQEALSLHPEHISAYGLIPEEGTPLVRELEAGRLTLPEVETERDMYDTLLKALSRAGFEQYEISNFARPGFACRHNIGYWSQTPYLGLGLAAASLVLPQKNGEGLKYLRRTNTEDMDAYLFGIAEAAPVFSEQTSIPPEEARFETMMLGLRMTQGVTGKRFQSLHGCSMESCYGPRLRAMEARGLLVHEGDRWRLSRLGMDLQNQVLVALMDD